MDATHGASRPSLLIQRGVRQDYAGDFRGALRTWQRLQELAPTHPAAPVHEADTLYWLAAHDEGRGELRAQIRARAEEGMRRARMFLDEEPDAGRAWFYLGHATLQRARLELVEGRAYSAGRLGEEARESLERALDLDRDSSEAKYPLGLYYYFASRLPTMLRWLDWLWFVPRGDRERGLALLRDCANDCEVFDVAARLSLADIYARFEDRAGEAVDIVRPIQRRYPGNVLLSSQWTALLVLSGHYREAVASAKALTSREDLAPYERSLANAAYVWRARAELALNAPDRARHALETATTSPVGLPDSVHAWAELVRGYLYDVEGHRQQALAQYGRVRDLEPPRFDARAAERALAVLREPYVPETLRAEKSLP